MMSPDTVDIANLLGLKGVQSSPLAIASSVKSGLPLSSLERLAMVIAPGDANFPYRFVPRSTMMRRRSVRQQKLTVAEGDRVAAVAKVWEFAIEVYKDEHKAREFLNRPHPMLENERPIDVAIDTAIGAGLVVNLLGRAAYGGGD